MLPRLAPILHACATPDDDYDEGGAAREALRQVNFCTAKAAECRRNFEHNPFSRHRQMWLRLELLWFRLARSYADSVAEAAPRNGAGPQMPGPAKPVALPRLRQEETTLRTRRRRRSTG